jgi:hypothetical protein
MGKVVAHCEIVEAGISRNNLLQQFAQLRDVPLPVANLVDQPILGVLARDAENPVESRVGDDNSQFAI